MRPVSWAAWARAADLVASAAAIAHAAHERLPLPPERRQGVERGDRRGCGPETHGQAPARGLAREAVRHVDPEIERSADRSRSEEHTSELQSQFHRVCRLLLEKKNDALGALAPDRPDTPTVQSVARA